MEKNFLRRIELNKKIIDIVWTTHRLSVIQETTRNMAIGKWPKYELVLVLVMCWY